LQTVLALEIARARSITPNNCLSSIDGTDSSIVVFVIRILGTTESLMARKSRPVSRPAKTKKKTSKTKKTTKKAKAKTAPAKAKAPKATARKAKPAKKAPPQGFFSSLFS
jgi:BRCT domain type II-containing protein